MLNLLLCLIPMFVTDEIEGVGTLEDGREVDGVMLYKMLTWLGFDYCYDAEFVWTE